MQPQLDANKLHVYGVALELDALCATLVGPLTRIVRDQLERASLSVVLNTAEAGGRHSRREKARFYGIARGSATELAALLDVVGWRCRRGERLRAPLIRKARYPLHRAQASLRCGRPWLWRRRRPNGQQVRRGPGEVGASAGIV